MAIALEVRGLTRMMELPPLSAATIARREAKFRAEREEYDRLHANDPTPPPPPVMPMLSDDTPRMKCIFSNVSFSLQRGTTLAIVGPAGCGKTQLLRSVAQLDPTHGGDVLLHGKLPEELGFPAWRVRIAYVQQRQVRLTEATGGRIPREYFNSIMALEAHRVRRTRFADPMAIARKWNLPEHVFETPWENLSASEHQRMMLAIALACKPEVLLLDEPTSALDLSTAHLVEKVIRSLGLSVIWATRDIYQAERVADSVMEFSQLTHVDLRALPHSSGGSGGSGGSGSAENGDGIDELDEFELEYLIHEAVQAQAEAARIASSVEAGIQAEAEIQQAEHDERLRAFQASHSGGVDSIPHSSSSPASSSSSSSSILSLLKPSALLGIAEGDEKQKYSELQEEDGGNHTNSEPEFRPIAQEDDSDDTQQSISISMSSSSSSS